MNCYIFAFATFGHPNDFRQTPFIYSNPEVVKKIKVFDLSNAIKVFPASKIYSIRKECVENSNLISYTIYSYAQEQSSKRDGTFIGTSITFESKIPEEKFIIKCLNEFHQKLTENNLYNNVLKVNHSNDFTPIDKLNDFERIKNPQTEIKDLNFNTNNLSLVVYCEITSNKLCFYFKKALDLLNIYDTIYFTDSREVAEFVNQKGIFKLIQNVGDKKDFDNEVDRFIEERKQKIEKSILEFEREVQKLEDDKIRTLSEYKLQIEQQEKLHQENDLKIREAKTDVETIEQFYNDFSNKIKEFVNQVKNGRKLEDVRPVYIENRNYFIDGVNQLKKPVYIKKLPKLAVKTGMRTEHNHQVFEPKINRKKEDVVEFKEKGNRISKFKVATFILTLVLIFSWIYFIITIKTTTPAIFEKQAITPLQPEKIKL